MLSPGSLVVIGAVALVVFGPKKLPELGKAAGKTLREFKNATNGLLDDDSTKESNKKHTQDIKVNEVHVQSETSSSQNIDSHQTNTATSQKEE